MAGACCPLPARRPQLWAGGERCPRCHSTGKTVDPQTVLGHVRHPEQVTAPQYRFCRTRDCPVVYYPPRGTALTLADVRTAIGCKHTSPDRLLCYCFGYTAADVAASLADPAVPETAERIKAEVYAGNCRCRAANPSGRCCLGDVTRAARAASGPPPQSRA